MEIWRFIDLGPRDGYFIQSVYEAIAKFVGNGLKPPTIVFVYPSHPYVCIGVHQLPDLEVDMDFCQSRGIPIVRRQVGGGAVYLDQNQQFYHIIIPKDHELTKGSIKDFFQRILQAVVEFYRSYGLPAEYKPINDVVIRGRKASGNGAALLHNAMVLIGNVILDFDAELAARVLRVPDEKLKNYISSSMKEWITSLKRELGFIPQREEVITKLKNSFEEVLQVKLIDSTLSDEEFEETLRIANDMKKREWLYALAHGREDLVRRYDPSSRIVKIREGHYIVYADYRGTKTIRIIAEVVNRTIENVIISGDFFIAPPESLEKLTKRLMGINIKDLDVKLNDVIKHWFNNEVLQSAGLTERDLTESIHKVIEMLNSYIN